MIDPLKEWKAETEAVNLGAKTLETVALEKTGQDWRVTTEQRQREHALRAAGGLEPQILGPGGKAAPAEGDDEDGDDEKPRRKSNADS